MAATLGMVKSGLGLAVLLGYVIPMASQLGLKAAPVTGVGIPPRLVADHALERTAINCCCVIRRIASKQT